MVDFIFFNGSSNMMRLACRADERLIGELFVLSVGRGRTLKRAAGVQLSHRCVDRQVANVGVLWRPNGSTFWQSAESSPVCRCYVKPRP